MDKDLCSKFWKVAIECGWLLISGGVVGKELSLVLLKVFEKDSGAFRGYMEECSGEARARKEEHEAHFRYLETSKMLKA